MLTLGLALVVLGLFGLVLRGVRRVRPDSITRPRIFLLQVALVAAWVFGGNLLAEIWERSAHDAWRAVDPAAVAAAKTRDSAPNPAGLELVKLAALLGIRIGPPDGAKAPGPDPLGEVGLAGLFAYLDGAFKQPDDRLGRAPAELRAWLVLQDVPARAVEKHLLAAGRVEWGSRGTDDALPYSPPELTRLHAVLTAGALERMRAGDLSGASSALEAAAALAASLRERSETLSRLVAVTLDRRLLGALRLLDPIPAGWSQKLAEIEAQTRPAGALAGETLELLAHVRRPDTTLRGLILEMDVGPPLGESHRSWLSERILSLCGLGVPVERLAEAIASEKQQTQTSFFRFVQGPLERPYMRLAVADYATVQVRTASAVANGDSCGPMPLAASEQVASWSALAETGEPFVPRLGRTAAILRAELELTRIVERARTLRAQSRRLAWPKDLPGADSQACPGRRFVAQLVDGQAEIRLEPEAFANHEATVSFRMLGR
jgi:hypothetical protein